MLRFQAITNRPQSWGRAAALAAALLLLAAVPAQAVSIYLAGPGLYGFAPNTETDPSFLPPPAPSVGVFDFDGQVPFLVSSGAAQVISDPTTPGFNDPLVVQFQWTVQNDTLDPWYDAHLVLLRVADWDYTGYNGPVNGLGFETEGAPLSPYQHPPHSLQGFGSDLLAAVPLGYIPAGGSESFIIRYNIAGTIDVDPQGGTALDS